MFKFSFGSQPIYLLLRSVLCNSLKLMRSRAFPAMLNVVQTKKKMMNVLLINQLATDLFCSVLIILSYSVHLVNIYFIGPSGHWLCFFFSSDLPLWIGLNSSAINLVVIAVERYVKVVHSVWHKNNFKRWMAYFGCAFSWGTAIIGNFFNFIFTTYVSDGQCFPLTYFATRAGELAFVWFNYFYYFHLPVMMFVVCYVRIFQVIRQQNRIFQQSHRDAAPVASSSAAAAAVANSHSHRSSQSQLNAVKVMTFTTMFFTVSWLPFNIYFVVQVTASVALGGTLWLVTLFIALFNVCANPFIYIFSYDDVRIYLFKKFTGWHNALRGQTNSNLSVVITVSESMQTASTFRR
jgi:hypothetical protein